MERRVSVNAGTLPAVTPDGLPQVWHPPDWPRGQALGDGGHRDPGPPGQRECLYLGPGGERCKRPGLAGGFCGAHDPDRSSGPTTHPIRFWAVAGAILALLWPYLDFAVREIIGWARAR